MWRKPGGELLKGDRRARSPPPGGQRPSENDEDRREAEPRRADLNSYAPLAASNCNACAVETRWDLHARFFTADGSRVSIAIWPRDIPPLSHPRSRHPDTHRLAARGR